MQTRLFDFALPADLVALRPAVPRDGARLMVVHPDGRLEHRHFRDLTDYIRKDDILLINDSRVIAARLNGTRPSRVAGAPAVPLEVTLHQRIDADRYRAFAKPAKRLRDGDRLDFSLALQAAIALRAGGEVELVFNASGADLDRRITQVGAMPLPPYIAKRRPPDRQDHEDYQTVYAGAPGSVAAPTAGLHFTKPMLASLTERGVAIVSLTLHVGAGTFLPVAVDDTRDHVMHAEHGCLSPAATAQLNGAHAAGGRICAVGTTALRNLESAADEAGMIRPFDAETAIFITPGYRFRATDMLVTNFHLPRSTLFMLVSAFMGLETMQAAYAEAIRERYRFYSYGDACLLIRPQ